MKPISFLLALVIFSSCQNTTSVSESIPEEISKGEIYPIQVYSARIDNKTKVEVLETSGKWMKVKVSNNVKFGLGIVGWVNSENPTYLWPVVHDGIEPRFIEN